MFLLSAAALLAGGCEPWPPPGPPEPATPPQTQPETQPETQPAVDNSGPVSLLGIADRAERVGFLIESWGAAEVLQAIGQLGPQQRFGLLFYPWGESDQLAADEKVGLLEANDRNKQAAAKFINVRPLLASGGRQPPDEAFKRLFDAPDGPPQVIYLLTAGAFGPDTVALIRSLNAERRPPVRVHCILTRRTGDAGTARLIADDNGGTFRLLTEDELEGQADQDG